MLLQGYGTLYAYLQMVVSIPLEATSLGSWGLVLIKLR
jgi:hypothetical protein